MSKVTIEDISRHTGLSRGTVSRALNDRPDISHQTKQKVLDACRQLNYVPSHAARSLATGRSFAVATLVEDLRSAFAASFLRGLIVCAQTQRYAVFVTELGTDYQQAIQQVCGLARERVDGVIIAAPIGTEHAKPILEVLDQRPLVACATIDGVSCDVLAPDDREAGRLAARHLLRGGTPDVLYVHDPEVTGAKERLAGFHEICREHHLDPAHLTVELPSPSSSHGDRYEAVRSRLSGLRALIASDDYLATQLLLLCFQAGRTPGRDIAVMGQGNELIGSRITPALTTIDFSAEELGRRTMELALQRVTKVRLDAPQTTYVAPLLLERESTRVS